MSGGEPGIAGVGPARPGAGSGAEPRLLVVGLGGLGAVVAATLAEAGVPVEAWARRADVRAHVRSRGIVLADSRGTRPVPVVVVDRPTEGAYDFVLLVLPPDAVADAARAALPLLAPGGALVPLANGLPEERLLSAADPPIGAGVDPHAPAVVADPPIGAGVDPPAHAVAADPPVGAGVDPPAPAIAADRLIGAVVDLSASTPAPGVAARSTAGRIVLGRPLGAPDAVVGRLVRLLAPLGDVRATANLRGARWAKLALNCAFSAIATAGGGRVGPLLRRAAVRRLALHVFGEVGAVAAAVGVEVEEAGPLRIARVSIAPGEDPPWPVAGARHAALLAGAWPYRRSRSSMLAQLERGRTPPVAYLNGEVVARGRRHGIPTPANAALLEGIVAIARGDARPSPATLERIARAARDGRRFTS